jgi:ATP-dependent exoDNAse (exonuclease V) alpha subunit
MREKFNGQEQMLIRIKLNTLENDLSFILTRKQFPVQLCFAITVNKSQGQSLVVVGVDL